MYSRRHTLTLCSLAVGQSRLLLRFASIVFDATDACANVAFIVDQSGGKHYYFTNIRSRLRLYHYAERVSFEMTVHLHDRRFPVKVHPLHTMCLYPYMYSMYSMSLPCTCALKHIREAM